MGDKTTHNPFALLGVEPRYQISRAQIEREYLARLARSHPDAGTDGTNADAAALNQAKTALLDDESRAVALLRLLGGPDSSAHKGLPDGFLMEMMTRREEIEDQIQAGGDGARQTWAHWAQEERSGYRDRVGALFASLPRHPDRASLEAIRVELNAWRYIERLIEQLDPEYDPSRADFR